MEILIFEEFLGLKRTVSRRTGVKIDFTVDCVMVT